MFYRRVETGRQKQQHTQTPFVELRTTSESNSVAQFEPVN